MRVSLHCLERYPGQGEGERGLDALNAFTAYKGSVDRLRGGADIAALVVANLTDVGTFMSNTYSSK